MRQVQCPNCGSFRTKKGGLVNRLTAPPSNDPTNRSAGCGCALVPLVLPFWLLYRIFTGFKPLPWVCANCRYVWKRGT